MTSAPSCSLKPEKAIAFTLPSMLMCYPAQGRAFSMPCTADAACSASGAAIFKRGHTPSQRPERFGCRAHKRRGLHALPRCQARGQSHGPRGRLPLSPENSFYMDVTDARPISRRADPQD